MAAPVYLTINQVADRLQVEHRTVRKAIRIGRLEAFKVFQQWRISEDALLEYVQSCTPMIQIRNKRKSA